MRACSLALLLATSGCGDRAPTDAESPGSDDSDTPVVDRDDDGFTVPDDCDDLDPDVSPAAVERCNGIDDDCDGLRDDQDPSVAAAELVPLFADVDGDGSGAGVAVETGCPTGAAHLSTSDDDCDDANAARHPGATEMCAPGDEDCDDLVDEADPSLSDTNVTTWWDDRDHDGFGDPFAPIQSCGGAPSGRVDNADDCDDTRSSVHPGGLEVCDELDDDCDGSIDDADADVVPDQRWFVDADGDGVPADGPVDACVAPSHGMHYDPEDPFDCDDTDAARHPGADDVPDDHVDQDCDGQDAYIGSFTVAGRLWCEFPSAGDPDGTPAAPGYARIYTAQPWSCPPLSGCTFAAGMVPIAGTSLGGDGSFTLTFDALSSTVGNVFLVTDNDPGVCGNGYQFTQQALSDFGDWSAIAIDVDSVFF